jgi:hypothetical protein
MAHRASLWVTGKEILESWNCFTLSRLHSAAGTVAVLMMLTLLARTRCRDAISWYICDIAPQHYQNRRHKHGAVVQRLMVA